MQATSVSRGSAFKPTQASRVPAHRARRAAVVAAGAQPQRDTTLDRRNVLLAAGAAALTLGAQQQPAQAACPDLNTAANGLQWCDIKEGEGEPPVAGALIRAHYDGKLTNGTRFDSSYERGRPLTFKVGVGQVIKGWDMGILGNGSDIPPMKPGGKRQLVIPAELGYGSRGAGGIIPPGATLLFDVELLGGVGRR